ncbi:hypothetical protein COX84_03460 [Candidatus Micrarchaeota archaeon CG_4_10_14_0_2_um_filter_49_7]|nr:MAG: hypothetical protein COX84_03460 [Candidatus Micrarchaeota archaeon CG_4_10_14_0_2_um_filter_49_7]HII53200.1 phospholipid carrier-dependent glycosyltransferase [Candidatus Micrarchaeota archaeon]
MQISRNACLALLSFLVFALMLLNPSPFIRDEALYAQSIHEMFLNFTWAPHYLGKVVAWKPVLMFYLYSPVSAMLSSLPIPVEYLYRLPSIVLSALSVIVLYKLALQLTGNERIAWFSALVYASLPVFLTYASMVMTDVPANFFILVSLYFYLKGGVDRRFFYLAGLAAALVFLSKTFLALLPILLATIYYARKDKHIIFTREYMISVFFVLAAACLNALIFYLDSGNYGIALIMKSYYFDFFLRTKIYSTAYFNLPEAALAMNFLLSIMMFLPWLGISALGLRSLRLGEPSDLLLIAWLLLTVFLLMGSYGQFWYLLPVAPAYCILAGRELASIPLSDDFLAKLLLAMCVTIGIVFFIISVFLGTTSYAMDERTIGYFLQDKGNVLAISQYSSQILFYKFANSSHPDYGTFSFVWGSERVNYSTGEIKSAVYHFEPGSDAKLADMFFSQDKMIISAHQPPVAFDWLAIEKNQSSFYPELSADYCIMEGLLNLTDAKYAILARRNASLC